MTQPSSLTAEEIRLNDVRVSKAGWRKWGPYLSERQWGTVREDYSANGHAWEYFPHEEARSRTYRWGEDGLAGISDEVQHLCFSVALWNGKDRILKERLFGLTGKQGNHGEDVKEYYFYLDNVPTHAYMKYLYKYPQKAFPYEELVKVNGSRTRKDFEYELLDTGIFDDDRYFDVFVEYAKVDVEDMAIRISVANRGPDTATLDLLPTLWFRNTWSWYPGNPKPQLKLLSPGPNFQIIHAKHPTLGERWLYCDGMPEVLFTENETNTEKLYGTPNSSPFVKDGINEYVVQGNKKAVNPAHTGTKASVHYHLEVPSGTTKVVHLRLSNAQLYPPFDTVFSGIFDKRLAEADAFYQKVSPFPLPEDMRRVQRQAFAGLLWNKQCYNYNVDKWLKGDPSGPKPPEERLKGRNSDWWTLDAKDVFSMPDKWEYPWFAAWDLAYHTIPLALIDPDFAKQQLLLLTKVWYMHPNGQIPAYEWSFSDVNPPVQAWATMRVYQIESNKYGRKDREFLEKMFNKLQLNFTWWVNRKDASGRNIFEGGFLGLDNIGAFDRTLGPPNGGTLEEADATGWMGMYCLNLLEIALELSIDDPAYEEMATKYFEHYVYIGDALNNVGGRTEGLWDVDKGFYYGLLRMPDGSSVEMEEESMAGLIPIFAISTNHTKDVDLFPDYRKRFHWFMKHRAGMLEKIADTSRLETTGHVLLALTSPIKLKRILQKVLDENHFLSPHGIRSVSKIHATQPFDIKLGGKEFRLDYEPAESTTNLFGGNSNWRGPIWFPLNFLLMESLQKYHFFLGDDFKVECPTGSGTYMNLWEVSTEISRRLIKIFLKDEHGHRPVYGGIEKFQNDPHWRDYIFFHEYFHGDNGAGLGANHQTGWTGLVAKLIQQYGQYVLEHKAPEDIETEKIGHL